MQGGSEKFAWEYRKKRLGTEGLEWLVTKEQTEWDGQEQVGTVVYRGTQVGAERQVKRDGMELGTRGGARRERQEYGTERKT